MSSPAMRGGPARRSLGRWLVALMATVLLVISGSGLVAFAQTGVGQSIGPRFVPAGAAVYVEARLDMPDGQAEALAEFLSAFPGFADTSSFEMKTDELFDSLVSEATDGSLTYTEGLEEFVTGEVGLAIADVAEAAMTGEDPNLIVGVAISDRDAAEAFVAGLLAASEVETTEQTIGTTTVVSDGEMAIAVTDEWVLLANSVDQIEAALAALDGSLPSLADDPEFVTAFERVPSARLGAAYVDLQAFSSVIELAGMMAAGQTGMQLSPEELMAQLPVDMVAYLAAENDRLTLEALITPSDEMQAFTTGESDLAAHFPADTQLYVETRALGETLETSLGGIFEMMSEEEAAQMAPFEDMLGTDLESFLDFVEDAALGGSLDSDGLWLGMAAEVTDEEVAQTRVERILGLFRLLAAGEESGISISESTVEGAQVTTITLPMEQMGGEMPVNIGDSIDITVSDGTLLIGTGEFVESALAGSADDSLATSPAYLDALGEETMNTGVVYANVSALLTQIEPLLSMMMPEWQEIAPYATAVDRIIAVGSADDVISARMTVIVDS